jgi:hypothetical protein
MENGLYRIQGVTATTTGNTIKDFLKTNQKTILVGAAIILTLLVITKK